MVNTFHILNGDSLKLQFPKNIKGEILVTKECLVDGNVNGDNLEDFYKTRAQFISQHYNGYTAENYRNEAVVVFKKMQQIPNNSVINFWFEDDLFCQVNFWFVLQLVYKKHENCMFYLIRPQTHNQYGFGGLNTLELNHIYDNKLPLTQIKLLSQLWGNYQENNIKQLKHLAIQLQNEYPFILTVVQAHINRIPTEGYMGKPTQSLIQIMSDLKTEDFSVVFKEFNKRESIYGFGDLQVKRLFDKLKNN